MLIVQYQNYKSAKAGISWLQNLCIAPYGWLSTLIAITIMLYFELYFQSDVINWNKLQQLFSYSYMRPRLSQVVPGLHISQAFAPRLRYEFECNICF